METVVITVKTLFGFEEILKDEIQALGYSNLKVLNRAVQLEGTWKDVYTLNFKCRLAISVLVKVEEFWVKDEDDLYKKAKRIDWTNYFDVDKTFAVKGAVFSQLFNHTMYPFLVVKDAIVDVFREKVGERPNVNPKAPQVLFDVYIKDKQVTISLNTSGVPLFQRGYRQETGEAPMNEVLAAGLLKLSKWDAKSTFVDPMCGSGTLAIEAALLAADIPSMIERQHYAFKNFKSFDEKAWLEVQESVNKRPVNLEFKIIASDVDATVLQKAKRNAKCAPIGNMIQFEVKDVNELEIEASKGTLVCNPPYGERIGEDIEELYEQLGDVFKQNFAGFDCWIVTSNMDAVKCVGLKPDEKYKVFNGSLECTFRRYSIFEGSKKAKYNDLATSEGMTSGIRRERRTKKSESPSTKAETTLKDESRTIASSSKYNSKQEDPKDSSSVASRYTQPKSKYLVRSEEVQDSQDNQIDHNENVSATKGESVNRKKSTPSRRVVKTNSKLDALRRNRSKD